METLYGTLGVDKSATDEELKTAYYRLATQHHPDKGGDGDMMATINRAYLVLSDPARRKKYDNELLMLAEMCPTCSAAGVVFKQRGKGFSATRVKEVCSTCNGHGFLRWLRPPKTDATINLGSTNTTNRRKGKKQ